MTQTQVTEQRLAQAESIYQTLRRTRPKTRQDLANYVKVFLGIDVPSRRICDEHSSPLDYLWHSFAGDFARPWAAKNGDAVVWANRAGGKTALAAAATLLDCVFKPNCTVRILGGSGEQSGRMYDYLVEFIGSGFEEFVRGDVRKSGCAFTNGSDVEVLTQSAKSVRGRHVRKLRCDEVELFDEDVFSAAQFITHGTDDLLGAVEVISTMHRPYGLMRQVVSSAAENNTPVFKWCLWEVIQRCRDRSCSRCALLEDCRGRAKKACGYLRIDDCISQMRRSSRAGWESEMLCLRPSVANVVFDEFDPNVHVRPVSYNADLPLYRALDFGFVNPFVCLWIQVDGEGTVRVIDEYVRRRATVEIHGRQIMERTGCDESQVAGTFCDPAGAGVNDVTGTSAVRELRGLGIALRYRRSSIGEGIELIRRAIRSADGRSRLVISPRCGRLIEAMQCYHYADRPDTGELPVKDGLYDHPIDALRYFFVNYRKTDNGVGRSY